jgi:hypothetical protein
MTTGDRFGCLSTGIIKSDVKNRAVKLMDWVTWLTLEFSGGSLEVDNCSSGFITSSFMTVYNN